jgi:hypothetical protein
MDGLEENAAQHGTSFGTLIPVFVDSGAQGVDEVGAPLLHGEVSRHSQHKGPAHDHTAVLAFLIWI